MNAHDSHSPIAERSSKKSLPTGEEGLRQNIVALMERVSSLETHNEALQRENQVLFTNLARLKEDFESGQRDL